VRDVTATVENISLITASILSKKLAAGLDALVLDVKAGNGAFMADAARARALAEALVSVAGGAGLKAGALITDMDEPLASAAGNAVEVRNAVEFLTGRRRDPRLLDVTLALGETLLTAVGIAADPVAARARLAAVLDDGRAAERFSRMVAALGGPADFADHLDRYLPAAPVVRDVTANGVGAVSAIDLHALGMTVVALGGGRTRPEDGIDHRVGFDRLLGLGARVKPGTPLARVHARTEADAEMAADRLAAAYVIGEAGPARPLILDRLMPGGK
jgi:thymidine phosphorylase